MKIIACYSNKGGVGKTTTAVNLSYVLAMNGMRTLMCDLDPQGGATFFFRVQPQRKMTGKRFFGGGQKLADAIRGSDYGGLDILPAHSDYRNFDIVLSQIGKGRSRLAKVLAGLAEDYDVIVLDCPPSSSTLSENIFRAADTILVPAIPTTLSQRSFHQLVQFFRAIDITETKILGFFNMVQSNKTLHANVAAALRRDFPNSFLDTTILFTADIERMALDQSPLSATRPNAKSSRTFDKLTGEIMHRLHLRPRIIGGAQSGP